MKTILTDKERATLRSMSLYWKEVRKREYTSPLEHEIQQVYRMLGTRLLDIVEEYVEHIRKNEELPEPIMCIVCGKPIELGDSVYPGMNECWHRWCGSGTNGAVMTEKGLIWHKSGKKVK